MFWYKKEFLLKEINSIRIDSYKIKNTESRYPMSLRIFITPVKHITFNACTLKDADWRALQTELMHRNIRLNSMVPNEEIKFFDL
jgi:hypothetical protein